MPQYCRMEGGRLGMTFDAVPVQQLNFYRKLLPESEFFDLSVPYRQIRALKSAYEIQQLKRSGEKLSSVFSLVPEFLRVGMSELDLAAEFEYRLRKKGGERYARMRAFNQELALGLAVSSGAASYGFFDGAVIGAGLSGASPQGASLQEINKNRPVLLDYTGVFNGYIADMTRMFVIGDLDAELKRAFEVALEIQRSLQQALKPGAICEGLFYKAENIAKDARLSEFFYEDAR